MRWIGETETGQMQDIDNRDRERDSLFLMADLRLRGESDVQRVKVRNLSKGGMMAEGAPVPERGQSISVNLRNIGWVDGSVAWVQDNRFGIAFANEIEPKAARAPIVVGEGAPRYTRPVGEAKDRGSVRKI
ncbi:PilZ domain-containing protein [Blastomonas marina]|nr:PilZ domain-containing protein [Blastomonas marina]WPZ05340.1 PilZ domain-containing protein [Blastomonas marina]